MSVDSLQTPTLTDAEQATLQPLIRAYPFKPFRNYRILSAKKQAAVLESEIAATLRSPDGHLFVAGSGDRLAAVVLRRLPWDTGFFGVPMGRIEYVLRSEEADREVLNEVLSTVADWCRRERLWHVATRVDVADTHAIGVLEDHGFRLMDALVTYISQPEQEPLLPTRDVGLLREYRSEDAEELVAIARESYKGFRGRFHLDPHLPDDRCDELYIEWTRQCCRGRMADQVFVSEDGEGHLKGFLGFRLLEPLSSIGGVRVFGGGLGACRRDSPGAYMGLIRASIVWGMTERGGRVAEFQTQNYNFAVIRVYESLGARYVRADYTFHGWFGPQG